MKPFSIKYLVLYFSLITFLPSGYSLGQKPAFFNKISASDTLLRTFSLTSCGLNYTTGSVLLCQRGTVSPFKGVAEPASIAITGIPSTAKITKAFVWWCVTGNDTTGHVIVSNPNLLVDTFPAKFVGSGYDPCRDDQKATFRADVSKIISGNGTYLISGLPSDTSSHKSDTDGATLFIVYRDSTASYTGTLVIYDGAVMVNNATVNKSITGLTIPTSTPGKAFMIVSEMENQPGNAVKLNNGSFSGFIQKFWDYEERTSAFTAGQTTSSFGVQMPNECGSFLMMGIYFQTAVTPVIPVITNKSDTLISTTALTYQWNFNGNTISKAQFKKYLANQSGDYIVTTSYGGSNCYFSSAPFQYKTCADRIKPNINKSGNTLSTDSVNYKLQWFIAEDPDSGRTGAFDTAFVTAKYWVQAYDSISGCVVNSDTVFISVIGIDEVGGSESHLTVFPNPANANVGLLINSEEMTHSTLCFETLTGQLLYEKNIDLNPGANELKLDVSDMSEGLYVVKLKSARRFAAGKIVILHSSK